MIKFRGTTKEGKVVEGWLVGNDPPIIVDYGCAISQEPDSNALEIWNDHFEVLPLSLAMYIWMHDKNKKDIWGSIPIGDDGAMSKGGSIMQDVKGRKYTIEWERGGLGFVGRRVGSRSSIISMDSLIGLTEFDAEVIPKEKE